MTVINANTNNAGPADKCQLETVKNHFTLLGSPYNEGKS